MLNGAKTLICKADDAGWFAFFARVNGVPGREGIGCMLLDRDSPGFEVTARYHTRGGEILSEIQFYDCELPFDDLIIREEGSRRLMTAFNNQRASFCYSARIDSGGL